MISEELQYLELLKKIINNGEEKNDRTGVGTASLFGVNMCFDLKNNFPLFTTKKLHFKSIFYELIWFIRGDTNIKYLNDMGVRIWDEWADENGELGPIYGSQWRNWDSLKKDKIDQISNLITGLKNDPNSRRHIINTWNVAALAEMALPPCHLLAQFYVCNKGGLSCQFYQRSVDAFLGLPFNIASYSLLTYLLASICDLKPKKLYFIGGDVHLYKNHLKQAKEQLSRTPFAFPTLHMEKMPQSLSDIEKMELSNIKIENYQSYPPITAPIAV